MVAICRPFSKSSWWRSTSRRTIASTPDSETRVAMASVTTPGTTAAATRERSNRGQSAALRGQCRIAPRFPGSLSPCGPSSVELAYVICLYYVAARNEHSFGGNHADTEDGANRFGRYVRALVDSG